MPKLSKGRLVRYILSEADAPGHEGSDIPAIVTKVTGTNQATLSGFPDFVRLGTAPVLSLTDKAMAFPPLPGTWHWPPDYMRHQAAERKARDAKRAKTAGAAVVAEPTA